MKRRSMDQKKKPPPLPSEKERTIWSTIARVLSPRSPPASPCDRPWRSYGIIWQEDHAARVSTHAAYARGVTRGEHRAHQRVHVLSSRVGWLGEGVPSTRLSTRRLRASGQGEGEDDS
jgi:hypothetical protein